METGHYKVTLRESTKTESLTPEESKKIQNNIYLFHASGRFIQNGTAQGEEIMQAVDQWWPLTRVVDLPEGDLASLNDDEKDLLQRQNTGIPFRYI